MTTTAVAESDTVGRAITAATVRELLAEVERIRPVLAAHAHRAEAQRHLTAEAWQAMAEAGLFTMIAPVAYGGLELPVTDVLPVWEAIARIDSAAAWNLTQTTTIAGMAAFLPDAGAREIFAAGPTTIAGATFPPGQAIRVDGGWRVTARVPFASGCHHATWCALAAVESDGDGPRIDPVTGAPTMLVMFVPREAAQIHDTWHTMGMRGTGSADISVADLFVPDSRTMVAAPLTTPAQGLEGPLYRMFPFVGMVGGATVCVGIAAAAVEEFVALAKTKTPAYQATPLREQPLAQFAAARARARVDAARDTLHRAAHQAYTELAAAGRLLSWEAKIRLQMAIGFAAEACAEAVRIGHDAAGTSAIRLEQPFERHLRDVHVLTQHTAWSSARYADVGRLLFGLENEWAWLGF